MSSDLLDTHQISPGALEAARSRFFFSGETVADWARTRGFDLQLTYSVLNGRLRGRRGQAHRIAVALGLKPTPLELIGAAAARSPDTEVAAMK